MVYSSIIPQIIGIKINWKTNTSLALDSSTHVQSLHPCKISRAGYSHLVWIYRCFWHGMVDLKFCIIFIGIWSDRAPTKLIHLDSFKLMIWNISWLISSWPKHDPMWNYVNKLYIKYLSSIAWKVDPFLSTNSTKLCMCSFHIILSFATYTLRILFLSNLRMESRIPHQLTKLKKLVL